MGSVSIAGIPIGDGHPCRVVAELGTNHAGKLQTALNLITQAKEAGCDFVKLQKRTPELAVPEAEWGERRATPWGAMTKLAYRHRVEFHAEQYHAIAQHAERVGIPWFVSVWDIPSLEFIQSLGVPIHALKIPSARAHDLDLIRAAAKLGKPLILSTGMCEWGDVRNAATEAQWGFDSYRRRSSDADFTTGWHHHTILMQCTSAYPAKADESNLRVIQAYKQAGCPVGFSSHKIGIATCVLAVAVGANLIERHLTLDRALLGSDHRMSSTVEDLKRLIDEIRYAEACLGDGIKKVLPSERSERERLRGAQ